MAIKVNTNEAKLQVILDITQIRGKDKYGNPKLREKTLVITASRERQYRIRCKGLKPRTRHYLFFNGIKVADSRMRPRNWRYTLSGYSAVYGAPTISFKNGSFDGWFLYRVNTPTTSTTLTDYYYLLQSATGRKYVIFTDYAGDSNGELSPDARSAASKSDSTFIDFLTLSAASFAVDYIDIKSRFNFKNWLKKKKITIEG